MTAVTVCGGGVTRPSAVTFVELWMVAGAGAGINIKTLPLLTITSAPHCKVHSRQGQCAAENWTIESQS